MYHQITNIYQYVWRVVNGNACWYIWCYWWTQTGKPSTHPGLCSQSPRPLSHRPPLLKCSPGMKGLERQAKETKTWDPPLKARNPKTRMKPPSPARGTEWPGISTGFPSVNLQMVTVTEWQLAIDVHHCASGDKDIEVDRWPLGDEWHEWHVKKINLDENWGTCPFLALWRSSQWESIPQPVSGQHLQSSCKKLVDNNSFSFIHFKLGKWGRPDPAKSL